MKKRLIGMAMAAVLAMTALTGCGTTEDTSSLDSLTFTHVTSLSWKRRKVFSQKPLRMTASR